MKYGFIEMPWWLVPLAKMSCWFGDHTWLRMNGRPLFCAGCKKMARHQTSQDAHAAREYLLELEEDAQGQEKAG